MSEIKVNSIKGVGASTAAITVDNTAGTCTANITNNKNRNLIINGSMIVAQRGTSSTSDNYQTVDRFDIEDAGTDEACTREQASVASGTTPYTLGFRKCLKITNGNQSSGAGASDYVQISYKPEAQDIARSGWNYNSTSAFITLSFWIKSSVAQAFSGSIRTADGTQQSFKFDTPSLSADTWTKVTKTIPGNSNLTFDENNGKGLDIFLYPFIGTTFTSSNSNTETWISASGDTYANDMTSTWYTTNDATLEVTGYQLEVGSFATDFEHRSFGQELALCQRYFYMAASGADNTDTVAICLNFSSSSARAVFYFPVTMRTSPDIFSVEGSNYFRILTAGGTNHYPDSIHGGNERPNMAEMAFEDDVSGMTAGQASLLRLNNSAARIGFEAEL